MVCVREGASVHPMSEVGVSPLLLKQLVSAPAQSMRADMCHTRQRKKQVMKGIIQNTRQSLLNCISHTMPAQRRIHGRVAGKGRQMQRGVTPKRLCVDLAARP